MRHVPVLLQTILENISLEKGASFIDCNLGDGGHSQAVIERLDGDCEIFGFDLDQDAIDRATKNILDSVPAKEHRFDVSKLHLFRENFRTITKTLEGASFKSKDLADAVLFDLGLSSYEIDESGRGFSFKRTERLSMTFSNDNDYSSSHTFTAYDVVNNWEEEDIANVIYAYGEDTFARRIAKAIVEKRTAQPISTTTELAETVKAAVPAFVRRGKIHPATKTFQALRIAVNDELRALEDALPQAFEALKPGGKLAVLSYHSLEDRITKYFFKQKADLGAATIVTKRPLTASDEEIQANPRSRSAKLRILKKL